ncbi:hypothetical protein DCS_07766 [Drechmeria coniospora]|uniref:Transcription initiation factor TFIID subunit 13 n=1 Tax=Drechmeria coniospora TaxID=98403 RepID=A0A151GFG7_DRECN|nr:hypothetical protein DCS_07766 [Drechmeria coniospora]KYK55802.1 hypothetical protein DCS_07766 [Drechmeria coniospora]
MTAQQTLMYGLSLSPILADFQKMPMMLGFPVRQHSRHPLLATAAAAAAAARPLRRPETYPPWAIAGAKIPRAGRSLAAAQPPSPTAAAKACSCRYLRRRLSVARSQVSPPKTHPASPLLHTATTPPNPASSVQSACSSSSASTRLASLHLPLRRRAHLHAPASAHASLGFTHPSSTSTPTAVTQTRHPVTRIPHPAFRIPSPSRHHGASSASRQECRQDELFSQRACVGAPSPPSPPTLTWPSSRLAVAQLLFAHGDVKNPLPETVRVLDEILTDFMQAIAFEATRAAHYSGRQKIKYEDFEFSFRKNPAFLGKVQEVFEKQKEIKKAREILRETDDDIIKDAADEEKKRAKEAERHAASTPAARAAAAARRVEEELGEADDDAEAEADALGKKR